MWLQCYPHKTTMLLLDVLHESIHGISSWSSAYPRRKVHLLLRSRSLTWPVDPHKFLKRNLRSICVMDEDHAFTIGIGAPRWVMTSRTGSLGKRLNAFTKSITAPDMWPMWCCASSIVFWTPAQTCEADFWGKLPIQVSGAICRRCCSNCFDLIELHTR